MNGCAHDSNLPAGFCRRLLEVVSVEQCDVAKDDSQELWLMVTERLAWVRPGELHYCVLSRGWNIVSLVDCFPQHVKRFA